MKRLKRARRWLARLVMINFIAILCYFTAIKNMGTEITVFISVLILGYNVFVVHFVTQVTCGYLIWERDKYLLIPAVLSSTLACLIVIYWIFFH